MLILAVVCHRCCASVCSATFPFRFVCSIGNRNSWIRGSIRSSGQRNARLVASSKSRRTYCGFTPKRRGVASSCLSDRRCAPERERPSNGFKGLLLLIHKRAAMDFDYHVYDPHIGGSKNSVPMALLKRIMVLVGFVVAAGLLVSVRYLGDRRVFVSEQFQPQSFRQADSLVGMPVTRLTPREFFKQRASALSVDQQQVVSMTKHAWHAYRQFANWEDYLDVHRMSGGTVYAHGMALTLVDSLDTLFVLGLHDEFDEASAWVKANLAEQMLQRGQVSFFEVTIRSLGGLLSAYHLSGT